MTALSQDEAEIAIAKFCEFLTFPTVSSLAVESGAYRDCARWLLQQLTDFHQSFVLQESPDNSPVVVAVWKGKDSTLPVLLLNSHYDVVPAALEDWTVPPFQGLRKDGKIYGRGSQDMKCVCIQYILAIQKIKQLHPEFVPERDVILTFVPDEEVGGAGMAAFLESDLYKSLPGIALALDEGLASTTDIFSVFYGERLPWWVDVTANGPTGHGSRFIEHTAVEQIVELANKALAFRKGQRNLLGLDDHSNCAHAVAAKTLGDVTSLNITTLQAGVRVGSTYAYNCVPPKATASLDIRISPHTQPSEIKTMLDQWCQECSLQENAVTWDYIGGHGNDMQSHAVTSTDKAVNPWYQVFENAIVAQGMKMEAKVFPAATDSRFLRALGIRALGFSPMRNTEILLHENDECLPETTFLEGIGVYVNLIMALGSQGKEIDKESMVL